jgi:DNA invertase Pin-like site-specific DNA recombinase
MGGLRGIMVMQITVIAASPQGGTRRFMKQRDITAAIYLRLSRDDGGDAESNSISNQREILSRYATDRGFMVWNEYIDDGFTGTSFERPSFKRMIEDIETGNIGIVLIKDLSRLGRNNALVAYYTED